MSSEDLSSASPEIDPPSRRSAPRIVRLALKELRETLRDRRTIATLILMPILVYPLLSVAFQRFLVANLRTVASVSDYVVGFRSERDGNEFEQFLAAGAQILERRDRASVSQKIGPSPAKKASTGKDPLGTSAESKSHDRPGSPQATGSQEVTSVVVEDPHDAVADGHIDLGIILHKSDRFPQGRIVDRTLNCELIYDPRSPLSREALRWVEIRLRALNEQSLVLQLRARGVESRVLPVIAEHQPIAEGSTLTRPAAPSLATLVPLILILMTITGAVYPAIDLTAGERERGTLEILIAAPVPRMQLLLAKYVAVLTVAILTATVNLAAMIATVGSMGLEHVLFGDAGMSPGLLLEIVSLLVLFAAFFSAMLLAVTSFARSFKEAQAYLIPLMLASISPGMLSMIPDIKLQGPLVVTPLVNIVLLSRDLLRHNVEVATAFWVVISTAMFALAAIGVAARIFGTDAILYGGHGTWSDLFRRPTRVASAPTVTSALLCLAIMFPAFFLTSNLLARATVVSLEVRLLLAALVTILVFGQIPLAAAVLNRVDLRGAFQIRQSTGLAFLGAAVLGVSLWPFAHETLVLLKRWDLISFDLDSLKGAKQLAEKIQQISPALIVATLAIVPACCEEFFFRGFLLSALQRTLSSRNAVLVSSALFGVFHLIATDQLHFERLVPSTLLGLVLGWVCVRTGSVLPGMLLHAAHNSFLLLAAHYQKELSAWGWGLEETQGVESADLPASWLIAAACGAAIGFALVQWGTSRRTRGETDVPIR